MKGVFIGGPNDGELGSAAYERLIAEDGSEYTRLLLHVDETSIAFFWHDSITPHGALHRVFAHYINTKKGSRL